MAIEIASMARLGDITAKIGSGATPRGGKGSYKAAGISLIRSLNVYDSDFKISNLAHIDATQSKLLNNVTVEENDVLLNITGASVARCCMVPNKVLPARVNQHVAIIRSDKAKSNPFYIHFCLVSPHYKDHLLSISHGGATREALTKEKIEDFKIPLPPLLTQHKIATVLSTYDDLIENNLRRIKILEEMAQNFYREWFVKFRFPGHQNTRFVDSPLGKIPAGWEVTNLGESCYLIMGQSPKSEFYNNDGIGLPFHQGVTNFGDRFPSDRLYCTIEGRIAEAGDILFSVRAPVGRMNIADKKIVIGRGISAIRHKEGYQFLLWEQLRNRFTEVDTMGNGSIFASVTKSDMQGIELIFPPTSAMSDATFHLGPIHNEIDALTKKNTTLRQTRDLLLPKLISGEIDVSALDIAIPEEAVA